MERAILLICLCVGVESTSNNRYYYISNAMTWDDAQSYCRERYTDLAFIKSESDQTALYRAKNASGSYKDGWIGLYPDPDNQEAFKWSGGGNVTFTNWAVGQPQLEWNTQTRGQLSGYGKWRLQPDTDRAGFYCINPPIVEEVKSWEEALEHCRVRNANLTSRHFSQAPTEMLKSDTDRVWIGLRFLGDHWLWANGEAMTVQAWSDGDEDHQCPLLKRCAALTKEGLWETTDCQQRLPFMCKWRHSLDENHTKQQDAIQEHSTDD